MGMVGKAQRHKDATVTRAYSVLGVLVMLASFPTMYAMYAMYYTPLLGTCIPLYHHILGGGGRGRTPRTPSKCAPARMCDVDHVRRER